MTAVRESDRAVGIARPHLALALDVADLDAARDLWSRFERYFGVAKVGLELFSAAGPAAVRALVDERADVFVDLKLHDIPNTVGRAAAKLASLGATYVTAHAAGGEAMLRAAVEGFAGASPAAAGRGGTDGGGRAGGVLGVTVLTSERVAPPELVGDRAALAGRCGCAGVVCAAPDLPVVRRAIEPGMIAVIPGVRLPGGSHGDQVRVATPGGAIRAGASLLVIGRAVTAAADPEAAALEVATDVAGALASRP